MGILSLTLRKSAISSFTSADRARATSRSSEGTSIGSCSGDSFFTADCFIGILLVAEISRPEFQGRVLDLTSRSLSSSA